MVSKARRIGDASLKEMILVEPQLSTNPANPRHLLVGALFVESKNPGNYGCVALASFDEGENWTHHFFEVEAGADPWTAIGEDGQAVFACLGEEDLFVYHSRDGGLSWDPGSFRFGGGPDHEVLLFDHTGGSFSGSLYLSFIRGGAISVARSKGVGRPFDIRSRYEFVSNLASNTMTPVVSSDGTLHVPFTTYLRKDPQGDTIWLRRTLSWLLSSSDGGLSFSPPRFISESCGRGFPVLAIDRSSKKSQDNLYWVCSSTEDRNIYSHYSRDGGQRWSQPVVVAAFTKHPRSKRSPFTGTPSVAVNGQGTVGVTWQARLSEEKENCQQFYFSASFNAGRSFTDPLRVSSAWSCPENEANAWAGHRWKAGGDYTGLQAKPDGSFQAVWADSRDGIFQLYMAEITPEGRR